MSEPKTADVIEERQKLHNKELQYLYLLLVFNLVVVSESKTKKKN
jgi:hypothetical protein